jgi:hypothetical protein
MVTCRTLTANGKRIYKIFLNNFNEPFHTGGGHQVYPELNADGNSSVYRAGLCFQLCACIFLLKGITQELIIDYIDVGIFDTLNLYFTSRFELDGRK